MTSQNLGDSWVFWGSAALPPGMNPSFAQEDSSSGAQLIEIPVWYQDLFSGDLWSQETATLPHSERKLLQKALEALTQPSEVPQVYLQQQETRVPVFDAGPWNLNVESDRQGLEDALSQANPQIVFLHGWRAADKRAVAEGHRKHAQELVERLYQRGVGVLYHEGSFVDHRLRSGGLQPLLRERPGPQIITNVDVNAESVMHPQ